MTGKGQFRACGKLRGGTYRVVEQLLHSSILHHLLSHLSDLRVRHETRQVRHASTAHAREPSREASSSTTSTARDRRRRLVLVIVVLGGDASPGRGERRLHRGVLGINLEAVLVGLDGLLELARGEEGVAEARVTLRELRVDSDGLPSVRDGRGVVLLLRVGGGAASGGNGRCVSVL